MNNLKRFSSISILIVFLFLFSESSFAYLKSIRPYSIRALGMGNAFTAAVNDSYILFYNPAALGLPQKYRKARGEGIFTVSQVGISVNQDLLDLSKFLKDNKDALNDGPMFVSSSALQAIVGKQGGIGISAPLMVSMMEYNWGFMVAGPFIDINAGVDNTAPFPDLKIKGYIYNVAAVGFSFGFDFSSKALNSSSKEVNNSSKTEYRHHDLLVGISSKFFHRIDSRTTKNITLAEELEDEIYNNTINGYGIGFDLGTLYRANRNLFFSLVVNDILTGAYMSRMKTEAQPDETGLQYVKPSFGVGMAYHFPLYKALPGFVSDSIFTTDFMNLFDNDYSIGTMSHFGIELHTIDIGFFCFVLRGGLNQGYTTFGSGIILGDFRLDYAYFQKEIGKYPGDSRQATHNILLRLEF